jgi:small-conductance mechanosensitive channel
MSENESKKLNKDQLKVVALRQRIGEITSQYEEQIAELRADVTQRFEAYDEVVRNQERDIESLQAQLRTYQDAAVQEEGSTATPGATDTATTDYSDEN